MAGCMGLPSGRPTLAGSANLVQPATLLIDTSGGGSQILQEDTTMPKKPNITDIQSERIKKITNGTFQGTIKNPYDPHKEFLQSLPFSLESAIAYILKDFDYENNVESDTAIGIRMIASTVDRLKSFLTWSMR